MTTHRPTKAAPPELTSYEEEEEFYSPLPSILAWALACAVFWTLLYLRLRG